MSNFSELLKDLMDDKNLNAKELSRLVNIQDSLIYKYLNSKATPTLKNLIKLANFFDCTINYLVGFSESPQTFSFVKDFETKFYERYNDLLKSRNETHYSLKDEFGVSMSSLTNWKNGQIPYLDTIIKIAKYFDVSIDYLIGRSDEK